MLQIFQNFMLMKTFLKHRPKGQCYIFILNFVKT
jgi:hypothetical protein